MIRVEGFDREICGEVFMSRYSWEAEERENMRLFEML